MIIFLNVIGEIFILWNIRTTWTKSTKPTSEQSEIKTNERNEFCDWLRYDGDAMNELANA